MLQKNLKTIMVFALILMMTVCSVSANPSTLSVGTDSNGIPIDLASHPGCSNIATYDSFQTNDFEEFVDNFISESVDNLVFSAEDYEFAYDVMDAYTRLSDELSMSNSSAQFRSDDYNDLASNFLLLRTGNIIELTLDMDEGITESLALDAIFDATSAKSEAQSDFPDTWDAAQHFIWSFDMTIDESKSFSRTIGINHEWGISMINPMLDYCQEKYDEYIAEGYSEQFASANSMADTILYMPIFKYNFVAFMEVSYDLFDDFFSDDCIMDLWNNCYGRSYPEKGYTDAGAAFEVAAEANELVLDGTVSASSNLTEEQKQAVWNWDWYSY